MGYYMAPGRGDYYTGRGDLGGFLKKAGGALFRGGLGFLTGGPAGAVSGLLGGSGGGGGSTSVSIRPPSIGGGSGVQLGPSINVTRSSYPMSAHVDPSQLHIFPRRRRMNPANPQALRRALRRVQGFGALAARASADVAKANRALNRIPRKATKKRR